MSEAQEQEVIIQWADLHGLPLFHIPNGGKRNAAEAAHLKRQGVRAGVPDLSCSQVFHMLAPYRCFLIGNHITQT